MKVVSLRETNKKKAKDKAFHRPLLVVNCPFSSYLASSKR